MEPGAVQDAVNNDELPLAVNNHEPDAVRFPVRCQVSPLLSGVHWLPVVRCAFVACVISLVEWSILSAVHSHERDDNGFSGGGRYMKHSWGECWVIHEGEVSVGLR